VATIYSSTAALFLTLAALCLGIYLLQGRERVALGLTAVLLVLAATAMANALNPGLLPWLAPLTPVCLFVVWRLTRTKPPAARPSVQWRDWRKHLRVTGKQEPPTDH
jgi:hypothetical protein